MTPEALAETIVEIRDLILEEQDNIEYQKQYLESQDLYISKIDRAALGKFLRGGSQETVEEIVNELIDGAGRQNMQSFMFRQYAIMDISLVVTDFLDNIGIDSSLVFKYLGENKMRASRLKTVSDTYNYLKELINCALQLRNETANSRYDNSVEKAKEYIRENYGDENISLNVVSKYVNLSPTHFSMIFSQEAGKTFTEFLTETRMEKAKELLLCTPKRSSEIAYEVGFHDTHYFYYVFKKTVGCSPRQFRVNRTEKKLSD